MKPLFDIANPTAQRPHGRGLLHRECGQGFIPHD
jgi:hypothetical protein